MEPVLYTKNINKSFKSGRITLHVLRDISVNIMPGSLTIFKGRSGSGKTTLLNILGSLDRPDSGAVYFNERDITALNESERDEWRKNMVGFIFQSGALISYMSAYENIEFALRIAKYKPSERRKRAEECLGFVGLSKRMNHRPAELSGGEQQRVSIARAFCHNPQVLFADEPTAELDTATGLQVMKLFRDLVDKQNTTVVMTTHDPNMMELADRVYMLEDGAITDER